MMSNEAESYYQSKIPAGGDQDGRAKSGTIDKKEAPGRESSSSSSSQPPTDPEQMKADLAKCPQWIINKLRSERDLRRKLADQTKEQTRILLEEVKEWRTKAYNYQREVQEKEVQKKKRQEELERLKELALKAISQLQEQLALKDEQLKKKNEILALLKQRFLQFQAARSSGSSPNKYAPPSHRVLSQHDWLSVFVCCIALRGGKGGGEGRGGRGAKTEPRPSQVKEFDPVFLHTIYTAPLLLLNLLRRQQFLNWMKNSKTCKVLQSPTLGQSLRCQRYRRLNYRALPLLQKEHLLHLVTSSVHLQIRLLLLHLEL